MGGGIDPGETPEKASRRELREEVGAKLSKIQWIGKIQWSWFPEWAAIPKRKQRYQEFQGEEVHFLVGKASSFTEPTSNEDDEWKGNKLMSIKRAINIVSSTLPDEHPNAKQYKRSQLMILNALQFGLYN